MCVFVITIPVLLFCSYLMYRCVDLPGIAFSRWVYNRLFKEEIAG